MEELFKKFSDALYESDIYPSKCFDLIKGSDCYVLPLVIDEEKYFFKFMDISKLDNMTEEVKVVQYLINNNIPIPKYFEKNGKMIFAFHDIAFYASKNVDGDMNYKKDYFTSSNVIQSIALMHMKLKKINTSEINLKKSNDYFRLLLFYQDNFEFCRKYGFDKYIEQVIDLGYEKKDEYIIHYDLNFSNMIFENNKLKSFIDFSDIRMGYFEDELGKLFQSLLYSDDFNFNFIWELIKIYEEIAEVKISEKDLYISIIYRIIYRYFCCEKEVKKISINYCEKTNIFLKMLVKKIV